mmetsp:Transcript_18397/g.60406  ORF Transcript_18397/g.60406 Transcript_18397/m.60406 type:complete len:218 (+) Transcript_18397:114-767(+)
MPCADCWQMFELTHLGAMFHNGPVQLAESYDTAYPGICDPMPGWNVTWNPPDCNTQVTPDVRGLMPSAAWHQAGGTQSLVTESYDTAYPGICDPMPGWNVTWNPPDCNTQVTPDVRGLMPSAAWHQVGGTTEALAVPAMMSNEVAPKGPTSKASPGHLVLCGHAALMGAWMATSDALDRKGESNWFDNFRKHTQAAANAVTPVGGKLLETHVFKQEQ